MGIFTQYITHPDTIFFFVLLAIFVALRYLLAVDISKKIHKSEKINKKKEILFYILVFCVVVFHAVSKIFHISFLSQIVTFSLSLFTLLIGTLFIQRQILIVYGEQVEVSGQSYFKQGYKASLFSLFVSILSFFLGVFLCIQIFELDNYIQIGGLWAGILAFMGFTSPVWAIDMIAGIILLQSKEYEVGHVLYLYDIDRYVWIKTISLTQVKCIDLKTSNPVILRPSKFRDMTVKNMSLGIVGKNLKVLQDIEIKVDYSVKKSELEALCYEAFDTMKEEVGGKKQINYFGDESYRELLVDEFGDYAVKYKFFYTLSSPFYIYRAKRQLHEYLLHFQQEKNLFFSTPDLIDVQEKEK